MPDRLGTWLWVKLLLGIVFIGAGWWWAATDHSSDTGNHGYVLMGQIVVLLLGAFLIRQALLGLRRRHRSN